MKELCIDARMLLSSGIGTYLKNLIKQFIDGPFKLRLIGDPAVLETLGWRSGFDLIPCKSSIYSLTEQLKLPLVIPKCDIFWSPHYNVPLLPIKAKIRVVTIHDVFHLATFSSLKIQEKIYAKYVLQKAVNSSSHIFTGSSFSAEEICKYTNADRKKISVIYHGVDPELFSAIRDESALQKLKSKYQLPEKFVLFVGNVKPHKNLTGLLGAFKRLLYDHDCHLLIIGKKSGFINGDDLKSQLDDPSLAKRVHFLGMVDESDLPLFYQLASVAITPSFYEGFGLPPLEAMSCGCPVIVSNVASLPEVCGDGALYVNPYDLEDIAEKLSSILQSPKIKYDLCEKGIQRSQMFQWEKSAKMHIKVLEGLCTI